MFPILILLAILGLITTDIFVPSLPAISIYFQQPLNHTELAVSLFLVGFSVSQLFYGPISDRIGRKPLLVFGVGVFFLGSVLCTVAPSFNIFCLGRILEGLGAGAGLSLSRVVLRDCYRELALAVKSSQMAIFVALSPAIAPFIGGLLQEAFGFRAVFVFLSVYGFLLFVLVIFGYKETLQHPEKTLSLRRTLKHYRALLTNFHFMHYICISGLSFSTVILYANILPFIIQDQLHLSAAVNGGMLLFAALGLSFSAFMSSRLVKHTSPRKLLRFGLGVLTLSGVLLMATQMLFGIHLATLIILIFMVTASCGLLLPNASALAFAQIEVNIGIAGAIYGFTQTFISMIINFILNGIPHQSQALLGIFYLILGLIGLALLSVRTKDTLQ